MIEYIYIVKCPNCEDEHFHFFNEAKDFALGCLSKKPIITQTEVNRNDFGECTDHSDLGTIWSWEEVMKDVPAEPEATVFSKSETFDCKCGGNCKCHHDPEFEDIDFSADDEYPLDEGMNRAEQEELMKLCRELGIETPGQLQDLAKALDLPGRTPLEKLRSYAARLSDDAPVTEDDDIIAINGTRIHFTDRSDIDEFNRLCDKYEINPDNIEDFMAEYEFLNWNDGRAVLDALREYDEEVQSIPENFNTARKPVPEGMSIKDLVEAMEENEDMVECAGCEELFPKDECTYKDDIGYLCYDCEDSVVKCTWCEELYDRSECRKEVDLGWLCSRCEMGIKSRGETLTFREGSYWDDLDEKLDIDLSNIIDSSDMEIWGIKPISETTYKAILLKRYENVPFKGVGYPDEIDHIESEMFDLGGLFVFHFDKDGFPSLRRWDPELLNSLGTCEIIFDDERYDQACEKTLNGSTTKLEGVDPGVVHDLGNEYDGGYPDEIPEIEEVSDFHLSLCPECGKDSYDVETGICIDCGFN